MRIAALLLLAAGCGAPPANLGCDGVDGACLELKVSIDGTQVVIDQLDVALSRATAFEALTPPTPGNPVLLPVTVAIQLHDVSGNIGIGVRGLRGGVVIGFGVTQAEVAPGGHVTVDVLLDPAILFDAGPVDRAFVLPDLLDTPDLGTPDLGTSDLALAPRLIFLLPATNGALGAPATVDQACTAAANAAGHPGQFAALLGYHDLKSPNQRIDLSGAGAIVRPDGLVVASAGNQLWAQNHFNSVGLLADKTMATATCVWTNFTVLGDLDEADDGGDCTDFTSVGMTNTARTGDPTQAANQWAKSGALTCDQLCHVYCIEQ